MTVSTNIQTEATRFLGMLFKQLSKAPKPTGLPLYNPEPSDLIVVTFPKAGTTLLRNMCYQVVVATGGAPPFDPDGTNFKDLAEVAPWLEFGPEFGVMECPSDPRVFKTHLRADSFDKGKSKFIFCVRNPFDYPASALDFLFEPLVGSMVTDREVRQEILNQFARSGLLGLRPEGLSSAPPGVENVSNRLQPSNPFSPGTWFEYIEGWIGAPHENVLVLFYEEVKDDLEGTAKKIAEFMGRELSDSGAKTVAERCDRKTMAADDRFASPITVKGMGLPEDVEIRSVKMENRPGFKTFKLDEDIVGKFHDTMMQKFGVNNYEEFCTMMRKQHNV